MCGAIRLNIRYPRESRRPEQRDQGSRPGAVNPLAQADERYPQRVKFIEQCDEVLLEMLARQRSAKQLPCRVVCGLHGLEAGGVLESQRRFPPQPWKSRMHREIPTLQLPSSTMNGSRPNTSGHFTCH